jgi:hypothetical protein
VSEAALPERAFLVAGGDGIGFALPMEDVRRVVSAADLPPAHRRASLPRLLGLPHDEAASRYAEVAGRRADTYLELGATVDVVRVPPEEVERVPLVLTTTALRWGWAGLLHHGAGFRIVLDTSWLASLAAPRGAA